MVLKEEPWTRDDPSRQETAQDRIPALEQGDRLSRSEFERRFDAMPGLKKAELIEGVVHMPSPVRYVQHAKPHARIVWWHVSYLAGTAGVHAGDNATIRLDLDNEPQPDSCVFIDPGCGGQARIDGDGYLAGAPDHVLEIASSNASIDLHQKLNVYRRNGVREYVVWRVLDEAIDWFVLRGSTFEPMAHAEGVFKSEVLPGLWLEAAAMRTGDHASVLSVPQQGLATPEHAAFVQQLAQRRI